MLKPIVSYTCIMCSFVSMFAGESMDRNLSTPQASSNLQMNTSLFIDRLILSPEKIYWCNNRDLQNLVRIHSDYIEAIMSNSTSGLSHLQNELQMAYNTAQTRKHELTSLQNLSYMNLLIKARGLPDTLERLRNQVSSRIGDINEAITNIQVALTMLTSAAQSIGITRTNNNTDAAINNNQTTREAKKNLINTILNVNSLISELNTELAARTRNTNITPLRTSTQQTTNITPTLHNTNQNPLRTSTQQTTNITPILHNTNQNPLRTSTQQTTNTTSTLHNTNQTTPLRTSTQQPDPLQKEAISYLKILNKALVNNRQDIHNDLYDRYLRVYTNHKNTYNNYINAKRENSLTDALRTQLRDAINDLYTQLNAIATAKSQAPTTVDVPRSRFASVSSGNLMLDNIPCAPIIHQYNASLIPEHIDAYKWNWNPNFYNYFPNSGPKEIKKLLQLDHLSGEATDFYVTVQNLNEIFWQDEGSLLLRPQWIFAQSENYNRPGANVTGNTRTFVKISESDNPTISEVDNRFINDQVWFHTVNGVFAISNNNLKLNNISEGKSFVCVYYFNATGLISNPVAGVSIVYNETDATAWANIKRSTSSDIKDKLAIAPVIKDSPTLKRLLCLKPY